MVPSFWDLTLCAGRCIGLASDRFGGLLRLRHRCPTGIAFSVTDTSPDLTVVVPVFNEAGSIENVIAEVLDVIGGKHRLELIVVDDGSNDGTASVIDSLAEGEPRLRALHHFKRSGKSAALRSGIVAARSLWIATMDGDGQDDPQSVLDMVDAVDLKRIDAVGLVAGIRQNRNDGASRKWASRFANGLRQRLLRDDCPDTACGLKVIPRDVFLALPFFDALHRYLPALVKHLGFETRHVAVVNRPRSSGTSKYSNLGRAAAGVVDLMGVAWLMRRTSVPEKTVVLTTASAD